MTDHVPKLKYGEFVPFAPDDVGRTVRINHNTSDCSGDSQSLSIWRNSTGSIGAKCYRCGARGFSKGKNSMFHKPKETKKLQDIPQDISSQYSDMPPEVATYLAQKGITEAIAFHYGVGWSPTADGLILPVINEYNYDQAQVKYFGRKQRFSTIHKDHRETMFTHLLRHSPRGVIIVEDLLSAIRVELATSNLSVFALLGSELNDQGLAALVRHHKTFFVWLDNDNDIIVGKAKKLADRLALFGRVRLCKAKYEPKDINDQGIINTIDKL